MVLSTGQIPTPSDRVRDTREELWHFVTEAVVSPPKWAPDEFQRLLGNYAGAIMAEDRDQRRMAERERQRRPDG